MKRIVYLIFFIHALGYAQQYNYQLKIKNFDYWMRAKSGQCGTAKHIAIWVNYEDNTSHRLYFTNHTRIIKEAELLNRFLIKKPKSIRFTSFIHEQDGIGTCNGYTASVDKTSSVLNYTNGTATGSMTAYDNGGGQAIIDVKFDIEVLTVKKDYNYKVEYDIDLQNKSLLSHFKFETYSGNYDLILKTGVESKNIYKNFVADPNGTAPLSINNRKYDSIVRFKDPINIVNGHTNMVFRVNSLLRCVDQVDDHLGLSTIDSNENIPVNATSGCTLYKDFFTPCGTIKVNYLNLYRIYSDLSQIDKNKTNFGSGSPELKVCEPFRVYVNDCNETSSYEVLYSVDGLNFKTLLPYARRESFFDLDYSKLTGASLNKNVKIRIKYYKNADCSKAPYLCSKATTFTVFPCAPKLANEPEPIKTTCNYSVDGTFKINFDRQLINERMFLSVYFKDFSDNKFKFYKQEKVETLTDNLNGTYSYTWKGLNNGFLDPKELYEVRYQTLKDLSKELPSGDVTWTTAEKSMSFSVPVAGKVSFKAKKINDKSCFDEDDGKIHIEVKGETTKYRYIMYEVDGTNVTLYRNWTEFTGPTTEIIKLENKKYRIKVQDSKKCYAR